MLEPEGYAFYAYVISFMSFAQVFVDFGFNLSGTKRIAKARSIKEENHVIGAVTEARLLLCIVAGVAVMVTASFLPLTQNRLPYVFLAFTAVCGKGAMFPISLFRGA